MANRAFGGPGDFHRQIISNRLSAFLVPLEMHFGWSRAVARTSCLATAFSLASRLAALSQFYAVFFAAGAVGGGALFAPVIALVGGWFRTGRLPAPSEDPEKAQTGEEQPGSCGQRNRRQRDVDPDQSVIRSGKGKVTHQGE